MGHDPTVEQPDMLSHGGIKTHMGYNQEAYDTECAALARALETAARRQTTPGRVTIFTNAQAAIRRMASEEPDPGQMYASQAQKHIAALQRVRPDIIKIRWRPEHEGAQGMGRPLSGPSSRRRSRMHTAWNGYKPKHS
jgi:hypothetical protein